MNPISLLNNGKYIFQLNFMRACLIHSLDFTINRAMGKSKELSIDLKEHIIDCNKVTRGHF